MPAPRTFLDKPAVRDKVPLLVGLAGPSGGGKTYSALRVATGMQRVTGGDIFYIDTEAKRALHYADRFRFRHVEFAAPFGSLDYLAAIEYAHGKGAGVIVVDSMSHEHEGPGGMVDAHEQEVQRMAKGDWQKAERVKMLAWVKPKQDRRRLINSLLQIPCNFVFCFRAKEKLKLAKGKDPERLGFMPIAGEEFVYEMTVNALLLPGAGGVPTWRSDEVGERQMIKLPEQFRELFNGSAGPLDEAAGEYMARWATGEPSSKEYLALSDRLLAAETPADLEALVPDLKAATDGAKVKPHEAKFLRGIFARRKKEIDTAPRPAEPAKPPEDATPPGDALFGEPPATMPPH